MKCQTLMRRRFYAHREAHSGTTTPTGNSEGARAHGAYEHL
jgi:hypothetical protein